MAVSSAAAVAAAVAVKLRQRIGPGSEVTLGDLGKCVVGHTIGEGGMGVVYRGWLYYNPAGRFAGVPEHPIALKVLHPLIRGKPRAERLFRHEAEVLSKLSHPNIVHYFGMFDEDGELCIAMELVQGESLAELLQRANSRGGALPRLPVAQAWHYLAQLLGALSSLHALGIVHRDVKSANVLIRTDDIAKLTDFGIARFPTELAKQSGGMAPGTGAYMAPEQVMGQPLDPRADLYAAAIVMFEMLTGITPFDSPTRTELAVRTAQLDEPAPPITQLVPGMPAAMDLVFARALAKHRDLRYGTARELGDAFRAALGLPDSPGWRAQAELSKVAKTLSMAMPQLAEGPYGHLPETAEDAPILQRTSALPPIAPSQAVAQAQAQAERYATDVMTAFKKG
ncbi:MAG: Serine/threonine protein kinase PrkC, regulator of stationary phase [Polyangiaceae bacterium]|jgi:serine/threonine-protein kinase|nr:Serine/threonine protein kinase PrkC, regulator of stationary phase [Polyangiaceae bacterium]